MNRHPLEVERLIGWLSLALGLSALQPNDSTFYHLVILSGGPFFWIGAFGSAGAALVASTYMSVPRCRVALLAVLLVLWSIGVVLASSDGTIGTFGAVGVVICTFILVILWSKVNDEHWRLP